MSNPSQAIARFSNVSLYPTKSSLEAAFAVARKAKIPQMPDVVMALRQELNRADAEVAVVADLIGQDLVITGRLLKTINSPAFNLSTKVASVQQAASLMGLKRLSNLVSAEAIEQMLGQQGAARVVWEAIIEEAQLMVRISRSIPDISEDEAYLFGIMHDVGCLIFASGSSDYGTAWSLHSNSAPDELLELERRTQGVDHSVLGFLLARHWHLPDHIAVAICHHHTPGRLNAEDERVTQLVSMAKLAHYLVALSHGTHELPQMRAYHADAWQDLNVSEQELEVLCHEAEMGEL